MTTEDEAYIERLDYLLNEVKNVIQGMSQVELNWTPLATDTNSPCVLATHIAGSVGFWVHQVVGGIDVHRDRDAEFVAKAASAAELEALLDRAAQTTRNVLQNLSGDDLSQTKDVRPGQPPMSLRGAVLRSISHLGEHLGHLTLTKQLYAARDS